MYASIKNNGGIVEMWSYILPQICVHKQKKCPTCRRNLEEDDIVNLETANTHFHQKYN